MNQNNINRINNIYNKNIIPIREESFEEEETKINESNMSTKKKDYSNKNYNNPKEQNTSKNKNNNISQIGTDKNKEIKNINKNNNKIYVKTPMTPVKKTEIKPKIQIIVNSNNSKQNLESSTKRGSIKNYLMIKNKYNEDNKNQYEETPKIKVTDNTNHTRIKNYLIKKNSNEQN